MSETDDFQLLTHVADQMRTRYYGKYRGTVADISDSEQLGRIKAIVPAVFGVEQSPWAMPCTPFAGPSHGLLLLPEVGDGVWIEFEGGDLSQPIWSGCWWARGQVPQPQGDTLRMFSTSAGHQISIDEQADEIKLLHPGGAQITIGPSEIALKFDATNSIVINQSGVEINQSKIKVTQTGVSLVNDALKVGA